MERSPRNTEAGVDERRTSWREKNKGDFWSWEKEDEINKARGRNVAIPK